MSVSKLATGDAKVDSALDSLRRAVNEVVSEPLVSGVLHESVVISASADTRLPHGLKRKPRGWVLARSTVPGAVYETGVGSDILTLRGTAAGVVSVYVY